MTDNRSIRRVVLPVFVTVMMVMGGFFAQPTIAQDAPAGTPTAEILDPAPEPTVVETVTPEPTEIPATETPTTEPTATETPVATETAPNVIPAPAAKPSLDSPIGIAPMSAVPDGDLLYGCTQSSETVVPGGSFTVSCLMSRGTLVNAGRVSRPALASTNPNFNVGIVVTTQSGTTLASLASGNTAAYIRFDFPDANPVKVIFTVSATAAATAGFQFNATFEACGAFSDALFCWWAENGSVNITATVPTSNLVEGTHFTLVCIPASVNPTLNQSLESTCTLTALTAIGSNQLRLVNIITTLNPNPATGWTVGIVPPTNTALSGTVPGTHVPNPVPALASGGTYVFKVRFMPTACSAASLAPAVGVSVTVVRLVNSNPSGSNVTSGVKTVSATFAPPPVSQTASIIAAPSPVAVTYNMTSPQTGSASFTARYSIAGCATWNGYAQMSPFAKVGNPAASPVPSLTGASHVSSIIAPAGSTTVTNQPIVTIGTTPTHLLSGTSPGVAATIDHTIKLTYAIPANTAVGTYQSTITVTTTNAP